MVVEWEGGGWVEVGARRLGDVQVGRSWHGRVVHSAGSGLRWGLVQVRLQCWPQQECCSIAWRRAAEGLPLDVRSL